MYAFVAHTFFGVLPSHLRAEGANGLQLAPEQQGREQPLDCGLLYYLHVPKTGGTTVKHHLRGLEPQGWQLLSLQWPQKDKNPTERQRWLDDPEHWKTSEGWQKLRHAIATEERPKLVMVAHHGAPGLAYMVEHELPKLACELKARGCGVAVTTMLREPVARAVSAALFNSVKSGDGLSEAYWTENRTEVEQDLISRAELQTRYLLAGHPDQWPATWHALSPAAAAAGLAEQAQRALSFVRIVGATARLDAFLEATDALLGVATASHDDDGHDHDAHGEEAANVTPAQWLSPAGFAREFSGTLRDATRADRAVFTAWFGANGTTDAAPYGKGAVRQRPLPYRELCAEEARSRTR